MSAPSMTKSQTGWNAGGGARLRCRGRGWSQQAKARIRRWRLAKSVRRVGGVAADGTTALAGAFQDEDPNGEDAGTTYVFKRSGGSWRQQAKLGHRRRLGRPDGTRGVRGHGERHPQRDGCRTTQKRTVVSVEPGEWRLQTLTHREDDAYGSCPIIHNSGAERSSTPRFRAAGVERPTASIDG